MKMGKKKILTAPKSTMGISKDMRICYNCMFYQKDGKCPMSYDDETKKHQYFDYNNYCKYPRLFRYRLEYKHYIDDYNI